MNSQNERQRAIGAICLLSFSLFLLFWGYQSTFAHQPGIAEMVSLVQQQADDTGVLPQPVPAVITMSRDPDRLSVLPGQTAQVTIRVNGDLPAVCQGIPGRPLDVMLVFDRSTSAGSGAGSNLEFSKQAALAFIDHLQQPIYLDTMQGPRSSQMGIITSSADASGPIPFLDQPLTDDYNLLRQQIQAIDSAGDSELARGIDLAIASLGEPGEDRLRAIFLVLHDDLPLNDPAIEAIRRTQQTGVDVYMIVNSLNIVPDVQIDQLEAAEAVGEAYTLFLTPGPDFLPDTAQLHQLFIRATQGVVGISGRHLRVSEIFTPSGDGIEIVAADQGGQISADAITWDISQVVPNTPVELRYQIRVPATTTVLNTNLALTFSYIDCNGYLQNDTLDPLAIELGPTPTPTLTPTPTSTPTPTPTPTPLGVVIQPTPGATPTPETSPLLERILPSSPGRAFCDSSFWWLPALLLPLLVLVLWWWWLRSHGSDFRTEIGNMATPRCWPCLLFWLYMLFFAFLVGRELFSGLCQTGESVYFWRLDQGAFEQNGLYLTVPDQTTQEAIPFATVNDQANCVGCHTVTSTGDAVAVVLDVPPGEVAVFRLDGTRMDIPSIRASFLAWSPDGTQLAYDGEAGDIHVLDLNSGQTRAVQGASEPGITEAMPAWSADGSVLAFVRYEGVVDYPYFLPGPTDIYVVPSAGGQAVPVIGASENGLNYYPAFSPDGKWLAFTHHNGATTYADPAAEIYLVPAAGGEPIRLAANDGPNGESLVDASNSWPTWSNDSRLLAFNSKRDDPNFDIFITEIDENGRSTAAAPLVGAAVPGVFEHIPFWGKPIQPEPLWPRLLALWPWLLPLLPLLILCLLLCREKSRVVIPPPPTLPAGQPDPGNIGVWKPTPFWDPSPALIIGLGGSGRHVLTHLKKNLWDAGAGQLPEHIRLVLLDTAEAEAVGGQQKPVEVAGISLSEQEKLVISENLANLVRDMVRDEAAQPEMRDWFPYRAYNEQLQPGQYDLQQGTNGRRPFGRAALFRQLQQGGRYSDLWRWLQENVTRASENKRVNIYLVSSLAGGFGSGIVIDVAYLARLAARELNIDPVVEGFLLGDGPFQQAVKAQDRQNLLQQNTFAALRELDRFQLAAGRPYPMIYKHDESDSLLNGYSRASTFDHIHLIDNNALWSTQEPQVTTFPAVADILMSLLDRASHSPDEHVQSYLSGVRAAAASVQAREREAVSGSVGSFVYRLPFLDIIAALQNRFALELVSLFLTGQETAVAQIDLKAEFNREILTSTTGNQPSLTIHARDILRGYDGLMPPPEIRYTDQALSDGASLSRQNRDLLTQLLSQISATDSAAYRQTRWLAFQDYLVKVLRTVMNGRIDSDLRTGRTGKLGYALALLSTLAQRLRDHCSTLETIRYSLKPEQAQKLEILLLLLNDCTEVCLAVWEDLNKQGELLTHSIYPWLQDQQRLLMAHRQQIQAIQVRHYLLEDRWLEELYATYLRPHLTDQIQSGSRLLAQLFWQPVQDIRTGPQLRLTARTDQDNYLTGGQEELLAFCQQLYALASQGLTEIDRRKNTLLAERLSATLLNKDLIGQTADILAKRSAPLADIRREAANITQMQVNHFLYANLRIEERAVLGQRLTPLLHGMGLRTVAATDPFSMQFVAYRDVVPLSAFQAHARCASAYRHHLTSQGWREPIHVFAAETNSGAYERQLGRLQEDFRFFRPLFTAGLENEGRARIFALAVAAGLIEPVYERGEEYVYRLRLPEQSISLTQLEDGRSSLAPLLIAMHLFVLGRPDPHEAHRIYSVDELAIQLSTALSTNPADLLKKLRRFSPDSYPAWRREFDTREGKDLLSFIRLVSLDKQRELRQQLQ